MNSPTGITVLLVHYTDGAGRFDEDVMRALERSFATTLSRSPGSDRPPSLEQIPDDPDEVADRLAQIIFTFSRAAAAGGPNAKAVGGVRTRLLEFVQRGGPVEVQMVWSPKKHWKLGRESAVDLAELAAFQTLVSIDAAVRTLYRTGMSFVIDFEDIEFQFMEGRS